MRQKKIVSLVLVLIISFILCMISTRAQPNEGEKELLNYGVGLFNWEQIENLQDKLQTALPGNEPFSLKDEMVSLLNGEKKLSVGNVLDFLGRSIFNEVGVFVQIGARFILIVLLCNLLQVLTTSFKTKATSKIGFFVCYMVIILSIVQSFSIMVNLARDTIHQLCEVMYVCLPTLLAFMTTTGYISSTAAMAPVIISGLDICSTIILKLVLPCIISVVILEIISTMSSEFKISNFIKLFYKGIKWLLVSIVGISVSLLGMYRMTLPYVDVALKKSTLKLATAFIPVVGSATNGALEFTVGVLGLVKNTFAIAVVFWILVIVSVPLIKILAYILVYQFAGAVIEPIGDKKMADIAVKLSKGCQFIMSCVGIVTVLCMLVLVICMSVGGQIG